MRTRVKVILLFVLKYLGGFHVSRFLTRRRLRILCYHGVSMGDEHLFRRTLFVRSEFLRRRMEYLVRAGYPVLRLADAVERLRNDDLPAASVVVTADDGWYGCLEGMLPVLRDLALPATLYMTTYYAERCEPVFDVVVSYLFWKSDAQEISLEGLGELTGNADLSTDGARELASENIVEYGNAELDAAARSRLVEELARRLGVDYASIVRDKRFHLIPLDDITTLEESGVDVQLHTHRHRLDLENRERVESEIRENRERLEPVAGKKLEHFCYPSGIYHPRVFPWLDALGIRSATTGRSGFCYPTTPPMELPRIVDGEDVPHIEFEAELAGVLELVRRARGWLRGVEVDEPTS